eukprot:g18791.t1
MSKQIAAALRTLTHDNVVDIYGWSPRLLSYLLNDPHCSPCLVLFVNHIANGSLLASSLPAFRVRKGMGLWYGELSSFSLILLSVCLLLNQTQTRVLNLVLRVLIFPLQAAVLATQAVISCPGAPSPAVIGIDAHNFFNSRSGDIILQRAYANDKLSPHFPFIDSD